MVPYVVKMAVDMKMNRQISTLVGNLEYYYAVGCLKRMTGDERLSADVAPHEIEPIVREIIAGWETEDETEKYLKVLLDRYEAEDDYNDDVKNMFRIGTGEVSA